MSIFGIEIFYTLLPVDEQDEYVRQIDEFKAKTGDKDAEISELRRELTESKNIGLTAAVRILM